VVPLAANQDISVEALNVPSNYIFQGDTVKVRVEAREQDMPDLIPDDFEATVDLTGIDPLRESEVKVEVRSHKDGVRVIDAVPSTIRVRLAPAETREMQVTPRYNGSLPEGYRLLENDVPINPTYVRVTGTSEQIDAVATVSVDVNLNGRRDATSVVEGPVVARAPNGNPVTVEINPDRAKVTLKIEQTFSQRTLPVAASITGALPCCYRVAGVTFEPSTVLVTGPKDVMDNLSQVTTESVDITGATTNVSQTKQIVRIPNTSMDRTTVVVRVAIVPIDCAATPSLCTATVRVSVVPENPPPGLVPAVGAYYTDVVVSAPPSVLLKPEDFKATVSLANGSVGTATYQVVVQPPAGVRVDRASPVTVELIAAPGP
jgi:YbbR domain-containing protein